MKRLLKFVIGIGAGFLGLAIALNVVFPYLLNSRYPHIDLGNFIEASSDCDNHAFLFFTLAFLAGTISSAFFFEKARKPIVGIIVGLAAGSLVGALSAFIFFYNNYN